MPDYVPVDPKGNVDLYDPFFRRVETDYSLPPGLLSAMAEKESGGNAWVPSRDRKSTAVGLFQINKATAREWGLSDSDRYDPTQATIATANTLARRAARYGIERAVGMHFGGPGTPWDEYVGGQTPSQYATSIFAMAQRYANASTY